ncbi:MAG: HEAT repeat domain-containing protein [Planctomycetota bacterium]|nr:HEAT repeat domain-containing protein [Planctomycetota bacterium]
MRIQHQHLCRIGCVLLLLFLSACTSPRKPMRWPWSEPDQTADLAKYGPTSAQKVDQLRALAERASEADEATRQRVSQELAEQIRREESPLVRMQIIRTAARYPTPTSLEILRGSLKDPDKDVRIIACQVWGKRADAESVQLLGETLRSDSDFDVRIAATKALGTTGSPAAVPMLATAIEDPDPAMQLRAVESMRTTSGKDFGDDVKAWREYAKNPSLEPKNQSVAERIRKIF